ncbi:alkaline phosphatase D [Noviherbaspirillum humi]|uniref:Alkaline phosphatase D n=1 Tax=Noviherbaspirillum humi TaxID=1688639 RepID=A0A239L8X8_9BURK|nr:alkaline phosphatase D family protein [Noviherbaspirillum humi]SNT26921.1 alkaline phosphatase D [Noviherbaspirillum humi]
MPIDRRCFLRHATRLASLTAASVSVPGLILARTLDYPFSLGVASGSPRADSIVLWTRILPDPLNAHPLDPLPVPVRWELAGDEAFRHIVAAGSTTALPELAHSVHVDVAGLQPDRWYWYRFMLGDAVSPTGRTRTAPAPQTAHDKLRLAIASCQHWEFGHYAAHRHIAAASPDVVLFLGDYIYEWGAYELAHPAAPRRRSHETLTLDDYRARYAQYKSDPNLQAAHLAAPWIITWDDHEVANDYANDRDEMRSADFLARRAAAYQAFYEHMPIRLPRMGEGPLRFAHLQIYDRYDWGRLARFHVLDDRQYRSYQACQRPNAGGSNIVTRSCGELADAARTLLGPQQERWLADSLASSQAQWNFVAQQTLMAQCTHTAPDKDDEERLWNDGWDGYPAARQRLFESMRRHQPSNPVMLSGDVHTFYAAELRPDFNRPSGDGNPVIATEFCGTSVTSSSRPQARTERHLVDNPHIRYGRSDKRGYMLMDVSPARIEVRFQALDNVRRADSSQKTIASFVVEDGRPVLQRMD